LVVKCLQELQVVTAKCGDLRDFPHGGQQAHTRLMSEQTGLGLDLGHDTGLKAPLVDHRSDTEGRVSTEFLVALTRDTKKALFGPAIPPLLRE
jgi:hypothetical protein